MNEEMCVVCKINPATQKHHLSHDPELTIPICVSCHLAIHKHGVGRGVGQQSESILAVVEERLIGPVYTDKEQIDDRDFIVNNDGDILSWLVCPNDCGEVSWFVFADKKNNAIYLKCPGCGVDFAIDILERPKVV